MPRGGVATALMVGVLLGLGAAYGQGQAGQPKQFRGRLPAYFSSVVDERQRQHIYAIQRRYYDQIEDLKAQLKALTEKRNAEVVGVLSLQQQEEVKRLEAAAKAKRDAKKRLGKKAAQ